MLHSSGIVALLMDKFNSYVMCAFLVVYHAALVVECIAKRSCTVGLEFTCIYFYVYMLKYLKRQDASSLIWISSGGEKNLKLSSVSRIIPGQRTVRFLHL